MYKGGYRIKDQYAVHFITFAVVQWVDVFTRSLYADIFVDSLKFCQKNKGLQVHAWCIMSNHVHLIISSNGDNTLSDILRDLKKYTSNNITKTIKDNQQESRKNWMKWIFESAGQRNSRNENIQFWQQDNHPIECDTNEILQSKMNYLHENPLAAGIVRNEWDYVYSSAIDYYTNGKGLININYI